MSYDNGVRRVGFIGADLINDVVDEVEQAHAKHGTESMLYGSDDKSLRILMEEVGEVAKEMNELALGNITPDQYRENQRKELVQVAAMALTWAAKNAS
jgi:NTP pyrophosphatase (non-canonical NTP hydrolase)